MDFGLTAAVVRFYTKYKALNDPKGMANILAVALRGYGIIACVILLVGFFCYAYLDVIFASSMTLDEIIEARRLFVLLLLNIAVTLSTMIFRAVINAHEKFLFLKGLETAQLILQPALVVLILLKYPTAYSVALVQTALNIVLIGARIYYCFNNLHIRIHYYYLDRDLVHNFLKLALSVFAVSIIDQVFFKTNQIILGIVSGTFAVAVYSIASLIYMNYMALSTAISGVYLPHITEMVATRQPIEKLSELFIQIGRWQFYLLALVASGFIIFGKQFILIWAGPEYEPAYWMTILIIIPFTIDLIQNIGLAILQAQNRYDFRAKVYFGIGVLNLVLAIPLAIKYGGIGCAAATGFSMFVGNGLIMNYYYSKITQLNIAGFWKQIFKIAVVVIGYGIIGYVVNVIFYSRSLVLFLIKIVAYTLVYGILLYLLAMTATEKDKIRKVLHKFAG